MTINKKSKITLIATCAIILLSIVYVFSYAPVYSAYVLCGGSGLPDWSFYFVVDFLFDYTSFRSVLFRWCIFWEVDTEFFSAGTIRELDRHNYFEDSGR